MSEKLSTQQEKFCLNIIEGMNQTDAYKAAGYKCANDNVAAANAAALIRNPKIESKLAEMRENASESAEITLEWLIRESADLYRKAKKEGSYAAANATLKTVGVYTGLWNEKSTRENINRDVDQLTEAELAEYLTGGSGPRASGPEDRAAKPDQIH